MRTMVTILLMLACAAAGFGAQDIRLSVDGWTDYQIVIPDGASVEVQAAAAELSSFLEAVCPHPGAVYYDWIDVYWASISRAEKQILVGRSKALDALNLSIDWDALGDDGFVIRTAGPHLVIAGGPRRGTINGVYTFLEDIVGIRWFTPTVTVIPHKPNLTIKPLNIQKVPVFETRSVICGSAGDVDWAARQRLNFGRVQIGRQLQDGMRPQWGLYTNDPKMAGWQYYAALTSSHTLGHNGLLPYSEFDRHPEYFGLVDGKRVQDAQPCLTNRGVLRVVAENAKNWLKADSTASVISISLGDFGNFCQCSRCKRVMQEYGRSGYVLRFVNRVAAELEEDYPNVRVSTLAYHWFTRKPPTKHIDVHKNVVIVFAPIYASGHHAYDEGEYNIAQGVYKDLVEWCRIAPQVWVWAYFLPESNLHPAANFNCLSRNFKLFRDVGVNGFTLQANAGHMTMAGGLTELQGYLLAKLMWDPDYDVQKGIEEFCAGCYGAAAPQMISYIRQVNDIDTYEVELSATQKHGSFDPLKYKKMVELDKLFDEAEQAVADDPAALERVKLVRLSLQYAIISHAPDGDPLRTKAIRDFFPVPEKTNIVTLHNKKAGQRDNLETFRKNIEAEG